VIILADVCEHAASYVFGWRQVALSMQLVMYFIYLSIEHVASYAFGWRQVALTMQPVFYLLAAHQSSGIRSCWHELFTWLLVLLVAAVAVFTQSSCHVPSYLHFFFGFVTCRVLVGISAIWWFGFIRAIQKQGMLQLLLSTFAKYDSCNGWGLLYCSKVLRC